MREVAARAGSGVPVLGICNGFQILAEARLVPGILLPNASLKFVCRDVHLRVENQAALFTRLCPPGTVLRVPVAHHDGNYFADPATLDALEANGQVAFRYCMPDGSVVPGASPNGSARNIAGVFNARRNVLGMMPHPENAIDPRLGSTDGRRIFDALVEAVAR
jgi:phosphoribosylformylglycinamidine synthase